MRSALRIPAEDSGSQLDAASPTATQRGPHTVSRQCERADHVVIRTHGVANDTLYRALVGNVADLRRVGDAVVPRLADRAISDAHLAARAI